MTAPVGLLGGTFDPVHTAHLDLARAALDRFGLGRVYLTVGAAPPHKPAARLTPAWHRLAMLALACRPDDRLIPCDLELEPGASGFTIDTLARFCARFGRPAGQVVFLAGGDSLRDFPTWRRFDTLLARHPILFFGRAGLTEPEVGNALARLPGVLDARPLPDAAVRRRILDGPGGTLVEADLPALSSTALRAVLESGATPATGLPDGVIHYIRKVGLYGGACANC